MYFSRPAITPRSGAQPRTSLNVIASKYERPVAAAAAANDLAQRASRQRGFDWRPDGIEYGRRDIDVAGRGVDDDATRRRATSVHGRDDERDAKRGLVRKHTVRQLAVVAEAFAVIRR